MFQEIQSQNLAASSKNNQRYFHVNQTEGKSTIPDEVKRCTIELESSVLSAVISVIVRYKHKSLKLTF
jgi:hypothetical protein